MLTAIATLLRAFRSPPATQAVAAPPILALTSTTVDDDCGDTPAGLVSVPVVSAAQAATLAPGTLYIAAGHVRRVPKRFVATMEPVAFAMSFERWLADLAPDVSTAWAPETFVELVEWFAADNGVAPITLSDLMLTDRFAEDDAGKFFAAPLEGEEEPLSPTAEKMIPLLATAGKPMTVKSIAEALNCNSAPVSRAIRRSLRKLVTADRVGRELFITLRDTGVAAERVAA